MGLLSLKKIDEHLSHHVILFILFNLFYFFPIQSAERRVRFDEERNEIHSFPRYISESVVKEIVDSNRVQLFRIAQRLPDKEFDEYRHHSQRMEELLARAAQMPSETIHVRMPKNVQHELRKEVKICLGATTISVCVAVWFWLIHFFC